MSNNSQFYYTLQHPQALSQPNGFQFDPQRSKTPTSLINHTGLSPGPLSTPPQSRNASQPPEQLPGQMTWDNVSGSPSDSPTSVKTPDDDLWEDSVMLDATTDPMAGAIFAAHDASMERQFSPMEASVNQFSQPDLENELNFTIANMDQQQLTLQFNRQWPGMLATQPYLQQPFNNAFVSGYTNQPSRQDPWNTQRPPQNPRIPQSDAPLFGPEADRSNNYNFVSPDVLQWTDDVAASSFELSPTDSTVSPMEGQLYYSNQGSMGIDGMLPSPAADSQGFVNFNLQSPFFANNCEPSTMESQYPPSSPGTSTIAQAPSPALHLANLDGSENFFTSHLDRQTMDPYPFYSPDQIDVKPVPPSPIQVQPSLSRAILDITCDSPSPETSGAQQANKGSGNRPGGRALGTHLKPTVAKAAHDMRKEGACWHCVLQRDKCGPGDICERCHKRAQRPNADCGLGCSRVKLVELTQCFIPTLLSQMHEDAQLTEFVRQYIHRWNNYEIIVNMTCGQGTMPSIPVKVYEFLPKTHELLRSIQYVTDPVTHKIIKVEKTSPALGMVHIHPNEEKKYDKYINEIVDHYLDEFGALCWEDDDNDFLPKLFKLMTRVRPTGSEEAKLLREVYRLIVATYIMSHVLSIDEKTKRDSLSRMRGVYDPSIYVDNYTVPRMTARQMKYYVARIQKNTLNTVLNKLQQIFKSSKGCDKWMAAFIAVIGLGMADEDQQKTLHVVMETKHTTEGLDSLQAQAQANHACREIDSRMDFICQIFRWKYNRKWNPVRDSDRDWKAELGFGDKDSVEFVRGVSQLVKENINFLQARNNVSISQDNQTQYSARLVGKFLLSFWLPS